MKVREIDSPEELEALFGSLEDAPANPPTWVFQGLDLVAFDERLAELCLAEAVFLGCVMGPQCQRRALEDGALVFPRLDRFVFEPYRNRLYVPQELFDGYRFGDYASYQGTLDGRVYGHYLETGGANPPSLLETLARRLHDHAMSDAIEEFIAGQRVVAIMGGHSVSRTEPGYAEVARLARRLTREGFLLASGGGPGAMEATHLGACFGERPERELLTAIEALAIAPSYRDGAAWLESSLRVHRQLVADGPAVCRSLGIPTWAYGHEPPTVFATHIAKYFANSVREAGLLTIARHGVVFTPGSAGTLQEVFQDAAQNHYETLGGPSPMIFFGRAFWSEQLPAVALLRRLADGRPYAAGICVSDSIEEVIDRLKRSAKHHLNQ